MGSKQLPPGYHFVDDPKEGVPFVRAYFDHKFCEWIPVVGRWGDPKVRFLVENGVKNRDNRTVNISSVRRGPTQQVSTACQKYAGQYSRSPTQQKYVEQKYVGQNSRSRREVVRKFCTTKPIVYQLYSGFPGLKVYRSTVAKVHPVRYYAVEEIVRRPLVYRAKSSPYGVQPQYATPIPKKLIETVFSERLIHGWAQSRKVSGCEQQFAVPYTGVGTSVPSCVEEEIKIDQAQIFMPNLDSVLMAHFVGIFLIPHLIGLRRAKFKTKKRKKIRYGCRSILPRIPADLFCIKALRGRRPNVRMKV